MTFTSKPGGKSITSDTRFLLDNDNKFVIKIKRAFLFQLEKKFLPPEKYKKIHRLWLFPPFSILFRHEEIEQKLLAFCRERAIKRFHTNTNILVFYFFSFKHFLTTFYGMCVIFLRLWFCPVVWWRWGFEWNESTPLRELHAGTELRNQLVYSRTSRWRREVSAAPCRMADRVSHCCLSHFFFPGTGNKRTTKRARLKGQTTNLVIRRHVSILSRSSRFKKQKNEPEVNGLLKSAHQTSFARRTQRLAAA